MDTRTALLAAASELISRADASDLFDSLQAVARLAGKARHPVALTGSAESLNPLVELARKDFAAYERVLELVDVKRQAAGLEPLKPAADDGFDKTTYMRVFMDQKRQRQRRAVEVENLQRPERDRLIGRARLDFMDVQAARWKAQLDARMATAREANGGTRLPKAVEQAVRAQLWASVDAELDAAEAAAKRPK